MHSNFYIFSNSIHKPGKRSCFSVVAFLFLTHFYNAILMLQYLLGKKPVPRHHTRLRTTIPTTEKKIEIKMLQLFPSTTTLFDGRWFYPIMQSQNPILTLCHSYYYTLHYCRIVLYVVYIILVITISRLYQRAVLLPLHGQ